ncbi:hypothetical protein [Streptomyces sp. NPDC005281]|uniref:hypothetical protein n=1 Tax=Streptomyces sp. NPDC005281 TaxID=3155712 RepID=UPI0033AFCF27
MRSALSVACAVALLTGCAAGEQSSLDAASARKPALSHATAPRCEADGYVWQSVARRPVLVGLSDAVEIEIPAHGSARPPEPKQVRSMPVRISRAAVAAGVRPADALASLEDKTATSVEPLGTRLEIADPAEHMTSKMLNDSDVVVRGRFVEAVGVWLVTAKFTATCAGGTVRGTVTTWDIGRSYESLRCGLKKGVPELGQEVLRRACTTRTSS